MSRAQAGLEKAAGYGFITDSIKDNMSVLITREEFAEVAVKLYEKYTGKQADIGDMSVFADTSDSEVSKIDPNEICTREMSVLVATRVYEKYSGNAAN